MKSQQEVYAALDELYATLPRIVCQRKCQEACGPIGTFGVERQRLEAAAKRELSVTDDLTCNMLTEFGTCRAYQARPAICRLWGLTKEMKCYEGCIPERWLSDVEARQFMRRVREIAGEPHMIITDILSGKR